MSWLPPPVRGAADRPLKISRIMNNEPHLADVVQTPASISPVAPAAEPVYRFWGKAGYGNDPSWHSALPAHLLPVAACFEALTEHPVARRALDRAWGRPASSGGQRGWEVLAAALHDLGKLMRPFQLKRSDVVDWIEAGGRVSGLPLATPETGFDHSATGGFMLMEGVLNAWTNRSEMCQSTNPRSTRERRTFQGLLVASFGHHGYHPKKEAFVIKNDFRKEDGVRDGLTLLRQLFEVVEIIHGPMPLLIPPRDGSTLAHLFAGWVAIADWLGSNEALFPFINCKDFAASYPTMSHWADLYRSCLETARAHVRDMGLFDTPRLEDAERSVMGSWPKNKVQSTAQYVARAVCTDAHQHGFHGALMVVEAPMGIGKTEAALLVANEFLEAGLACGIAFGLPAQASANMIFTRLAPLSRTVFGREPNLAHSQAVHTRDRLLSLLETTRSTLEGEQTGQEAMAHLSDWITDDNKKAFLAPVCAATVDQFQLAAMHSKHGFVRFAALTRHVVIIDEVHAYDAYMQKVLDGLLRFLGSCGIPTVLLSATLPVSIRSRLGHAYAEGAGWPPQSLRAPAGAYPVITLVAPVGPGSGSQSSHSQVIPVTWTDPQRRVRLQSFGARFWADRVLQTADAGGCVAVLCNSIASALNRVRELRERSPNASITLLHSRFRGQDRLRLQERIELMLGRGSTKADRAGQIVVATQVLEQSIDIDVDLMLSEPAPIDLLLQRMGRLHRHARPDRQFVAVFGLLDPEDSTSSASVGAEDAVSPAGEVVLPRWFKATQRIYSESGVLEPSLALVRRLLQSDAPYIDLPRDIPGLVAEIYGDDENSPKSLTMKAHQAGAAAKHRVLNQGLSMSEIADGVDRSSQTRNSDSDGVRILLVVKDNDGNWHVPDCEKLLPLPPCNRFDAAGGPRVNPDFLKEAQPWILTVPTYAAEWRELQKRTASKEALAHDWRFSREIDPSFGPPPFLVLPVHRTSITSACTTLRLCGCGSGHGSGSMLGEGVFYDNMKGLYRAEEG